ncbi:hypothetical protein CRUP_002478, partial [Coryphaenoides rupestris]
MSASLPPKASMAGMQQQQHLQPGVGVGVGGPGQPPPQGPPPQGALREISPVFLCRIGQETVQDIVTRTMEIFQITRATQSQATYQDRFGKLQEHLRQLALLGVTAWMTAVNSCPGLTPSGEVRGQRSEVR